MRIALYIALKHLIQLQTFSIGIDPRDVPRHAEKFCTRPRSSNRVSRTGPSGRHRSRLAVGIHAVRAVSKCINARLRYTSRPLPRSIGRSYSTCPQQRMFSRIHTSLTTRVWYARRGRSIFARRRLRGGSESRASLHAELHSTHTWPRAMTTAQCYARPVRGSD